MEPHFTGKRLWPRTPDNGWWQVWISPRLESDSPLTALFMKVHEVLKGHGYDPDVLHGTVIHHITVQPLGDRERELTDEQLDNLEQALREELAAVEPFTVTVGSVYCSSTGVIADLSPDEQLNKLAGRVRAVMAAQFPDIDQWYEPRPLHWTLAYGLKSVDSGPITSALRREVRPSHSPLHVGQVRLLQVFQDTEGSEYLIDRWRPIPLGRT